MYRTEIDIIKSHQQNLYLIDLQLKEKRFSLQEIGDFIPGLLHINRGSDLRAIHVSSNYEKWAEMSISDIDKEGEKFLLDRLHPQFLSKTIPQFINFYNAGDNHSIFCAFQQARKNISQPYENLLITSKILTTENAFFNISIPIKTMGDITSKIERALEQDEFFRNNYDAFISLSKREKEILNLVAHGYTNYDIGEMLFISKHTVRTHRNQINSKLGIKHFRDVIKYAQAFDLL